MLRFASALEQELVLGAAGLCVSRVWVGSVFVSSPRFEYEGDMEALVLT